MPWKSDFQLVKVQITLDAVGAVMRHHHILHYGSIVTNVNSHTTKQAESCVYTSRYTHLLVISNMSSRVLMSTHGTSLFSAGAKPACANLPNNHVNRFAAEDVLNQDFSKRFSKRLLPGCWSGIEVLYRHSCSMQIGLSHWTDRISYLLCTLLISPATCRWHSDSCRFHHISMGQYSQEKRRIIFFSSD